jgi:hypothetical protein
MSGMDVRESATTGGHMFWSVKIRKKFVWCLAVTPLVVVIALYCVFTNPCLPVVCRAPRIPVDSRRMQADVEFLTNLQPPRNNEKPEALAAAASYIRGVFTRTGRVVDDQVFGPRKAYHNIAVSFGPETGPRIVIGAHYDVCGDNPGADDNASGVAGVLELARLLESIKPPLRYRVDLVAFANEEPPFFKSGNMGSLVYARKLAADGVKVKAMICLEMIGCYSTAPGSQSYPVNILRLFYPSRGNFIGVISDWHNFGLVRKIKRHMKQAMSMEVHSINAPAFVPGIDFSDHWSFWKTGYPAVMISDTAFYRNPRYHEAGDTADTLDYGRMAEVIKGVYWAVVGW